MQRMSKIPPHHRITLSDVERDYKAGLITSKGAIFYAVSAQRKLGEAVRIQPDLLCERFGIHRSTFYRKLAELTVERRLEFAAEGALLLRVPIADESGIPDYIFLEELSQECDTESQNCDTESRDRDKKSQECDTESQECDKKSLKPRRAKRSKVSLSDLSNQSLSQIEREIDIEPEFRQWLTVRASLLPKPPALLEQWIQRQAKLQVNRAEFLREQQTRERSNVPAAPTAQIFDDRSAQQQRLETLQHWWDDGGRERVKESIKAHPEWGIVIGEFGPEVGDASSS